MKNFEKVDEYLYRSGKLKPTDVLKLKKTGVKQIISLDKEDGEEITLTCKELNIDHKIINIDIGSNKSLEKIFKHDIVDLIQSNGPTLVHCHAGKDRTGVVVAIYSLLTGKDIKDVMRRLFYFGFGIGLPKPTKDFYLKVINYVKNEIKRVKEEYKEKEDSLDNDDVLVGPSSNYMDDPHYSYVEPPKVHSFAPFIDYRQSYPYDTQLPSGPAYGGPLGSDKGTREYKMQHLNEKYKEHIPQSSFNNTIPYVGLYYNDINATRLGPLDMSGLFYD